MYLRAINQTMETALKNALIRCNELGDKHKKYNKRVANRNRLRKNMQGAKL